jgi:hypothetical protein
MLGGPVENGFLECFDLGEVVDYLVFADFSQKAVDTVGVSFGAESDQGTDDPRTLVFGARVVFIL